MLSSGRYEARLLTPISQRNPELTDPNHITAGQWIVLRARYCRDHCQKVAVL